MHRLDKIFGMSPIAFGVEVAEIEFVLQTELDRRRGARDLVPHKGLPAAGGLVIEQYSVARDQPVAFTTIHRDPVSVKFGDAVRAARVERGRFALRDLLDLAEKLRRRGLIKPRPAQPGFAYRLEQSERPERADFGGVFRDVETDAHVRLRAEVVNLVGLDVAQNLVERARVVQVAVEEAHPPPRLVRVLVDVVNAFGVERAGAAYDAIHVIALAEQQLGQIASILAGDACYQRFLRHNSGGSFKSVSRTVVFDF